MAEKEYHRHIGIYGICVKENKLLVVKKTRGPYRNRYDLPGGFIELNETLTQAITREFIEETNLQINIKRNIGTVDFIVKYGIGDKTHIQHIAIFMEVSINETLKELKTEGLSDDTSGVKWIEISEINEENSSPLIHTAKEYIEINKIKCLSYIFDDWEVRAQEVWK